MRKSIVYLGCVVILSASLATGCVKKDNIDKGIDIVTVAPTTVPTEVPGTAPEGDNTEVITPTPPIIEEPEFIGEIEATKLITAKILERGYFVQYIQDITIGVDEYYEFSILSGDNNIKPNVVVNKVTGEILCINEDKTTSPLSSHPLFSSSNENKDDALEEGKISIDDAYKKLSKVSKEVLSLPVELTEYTIVYDEYNTFVHGQECYVINAFVKVEDKMINMGTFYVTVDGSGMYKFDVEADDFVEIK